MFGLGTEGFPSASYFTRHPLIVGYRKIDVQLQLFTGKLPRTNRNKKREVIKFYR